MTQHFISIFWWLQIYQKLLCSLDILYFPLALRFSIRCRNWPYSVNIWGLFHLFSKAGNQKLTFMTSRGNGRVITDDDDRFLTDSVTENSNMFCMLYICDLESHSLQPLHLFGFTTHTWSVEALTHDIKVWWVYKDHLLWN